MKSDKINQYRFINLQQTRQQLESQLISISFSYMKLFQLVLLIGLLYGIQSWCLRTSVSQKFTIQQVDWAPNNAFFATANKAEQTVRIYNASSFQVIKVYSQGLEPRSVKISKDSKYVAIGYANSKLTVLESTTWTVYMGFNTNQVEIAEVDFTYNNLSVLTCGKFQRIKTYNLGAGISESSSLNINYKYVSNNGDLVACRCGPTGQFAYAEAIRKLNIYYANNNIVSLPDPTGDVIELDFRSTGVIGYITSDNVFKWTTPANITFPSTTGSDFLTALNYGRTKYIALGLAKNLMIYDRTNTNLLTKFTDNKNNISSVKISYDENFLLTGDIGGQIRIYSTTCGKFSCQSGYYNDTNICKRCSDTISFCMTCKSGSACENCMAGYFKSGSVCAACYTALEYCLLCKDNTQCLKCLDGYYLDSTTKKCLRCPLVGCIQCNSSSICTKCFKNDYYLNTTSNTCKQCADTLSNCVRCYDSNTCVDCQIGFYKDSTTKKCVQCPGNCLACQSSTNCTQCKIGYWASSNSCIRCTDTGCISCNQTGVCYDCKEGMFLTTTNTCTACSVPCATCSVAATNCTGCNLGYYLDAPNFSCVKCIENCKICNESGKCLSCFPGFKVDGTTPTCKACINYYNNCSQCSSTVCLKCRDGFYVDTAASNVCKTCTSAIPKCMSCSNSTTCLHCITSYYHTGATGSTACAACTAGCQECISSSNCTNCFPTFFKNSSLLCEPCKNNCFECSSDVSCLSCVVGYYLDVSTCKACQLNIPYCSVCTSGTACVSCMPGAYLDSSDNKCKLCSLANCLTCNQTNCFSCQVGYYLDVTATPNLCKICNSTCQQCTSSSQCTSCIDGYYLDSSDSKCKPCSVTFPHCTLCNQTKCLECQRGTQLNLTNNNICALCSSHITNCKTCYWDYAPATPVIKCTLCNYGYGLSVNNLTCPACSSISGCIQCKTSSLCTKCEIGFYLKSDNTCGLCMGSCLTCNSASSCISCQDGYVNDTSTCVLCEQKINGCSRCVAPTSTTFACSTCQQGYYLQPTDKKCYICLKQLTGCHTCNDSSTCTACLDKYYLDSSSKTCKKCVTNIAGCQICNSSSVCLSCQDSYYLDTTDNKCYYCQNNIPGCLHCSNSSSCSQCQSGYFLSAGGVCNLCQSQIQGCIYCNSDTYCVQCRTGYYLNVGDNKCYKCSQPGCQVCAADLPNVCVTCNSKFYLVGSTCTTCHTLVPACDQCNSTQCLECDVGYYLASPLLCSTCSSTMSGCSRCVDSTSCLQCMSSYFVNQTNQCQQCNKVIFGCQNCIDMNTCISCQANFYLNSTTTKCQPCTDIGGCMLCKNQNTCVLCQEKYFMSGSQCILCSDVLKGCFSCVTDKVCVQCQSGYILDPVSYECKVNTVEAKEAVEGLKLVTYYISKNMLKHVLLAKGATFKKSDTINITSNGQTTMFVQDYSGKQVQLTVLSYEFGTGGNSIIFYTDNPLANQMQEKTKNMQFRRLLATQLNLQVMVKMSQQVYREILPDLDYSGSMTVGYSLNNPEFMNSYMAAETGNKYLMYQIVGIVAICLFLLNYIIKFLLTMPQSKNRSTLLPHIIALKSCCLILYPSHFEYISFCKGFMVVDFPWLNKMFASVLTDVSDTVEVPFGLFFDNMSIAGTFLLGFTVYVVLVLLVHAYFYITKEQSPQSSSSDQKPQSQMDSQQSHSNQKQFKIQNLQSAMGINYDNDQSQSNRRTLTKRNFLELLWNIFTFSMVYYSCLSVQGAFVNYSQVLTINGVFYIFGMLIFIYVTIETGYAFFRNFKNISKVRIYLKACLLSLAHYNPIYIVSVCVIFDMLLAVLQFYLANKPNQFSKFFVLTHLLSSVVIGLMIFVSGSLVSLFSTAISLVICFGFQLYIHVKQYQNANKSVEQEEFNMDEDNQKGIDDTEETFNATNNVWDLGRKTKNIQSFEDMNMYATMEAFGKGEFEVENVELHRETGFRPETSMTKGRPDTSMNESMGIKHGRRNKQRRTQEAFKSHTIQVVPSRMEEQEKKRDKFSAQEIDSNSS